VAPSDEALFGALLDIQHRLNVEHHLELLNKLLAAMVPRGGV
jgi:hypothetical protein